MQCGHCAAENDAEARFCARCGAPLATPCPGCGASLPDGARFCPRCGQEVKAASSTSALPPGREAGGSGTTTVSTRKQVTVLFADVSGYAALSEKLDAEEVRDLMNDLWARLDPLITDHGGTVTNHMGDGIMALFGAGTTRESDPRQAVRAALAMQAALAEFSGSGTVMRMRIGIHTGPVVLGPVATTLEFTALGDSVNLASRLEGHAPVGGILISHDTYRQVYGLFDVGALPPLEVKGKAEPVQVYLVLQAKPKPLALRVHGVEGVETEMIGRRRELKRLQKAFETAEEKRELRVLTVVGEAGIGKSRLLHEFQQWLDLRPEGVFLFSGRATEEMASLPFSLLRDMLSVRFEIKETDAPPVAREKLERGLVSLLGADAAAEAEDLALQAHFIGQLLGLDFSASPHLRGILHDAEQVRQRAFSYLTRLFRSAGRGGRSTGEAERRHAALPGGAARQARRSRARRRWWCSRTSIGPTTARWT